MNTNTNDKKYFESFNFASVDIPTPSETISNGRGWVSFGDDNLYPQFLISLSNRSSLHSSILKQKSMLIGGQGWSKLGLSAEALSFLKNVYNQDDLDQIVFKIAMDMELYGGFYLNIVWSKDRSRIAEINYVDPSKIRIAVSDRPEKYPQQENYWFCDDWNLSYKHQPVLYSGFSTSNKKELSQILYVKEYRPGTEFYARPEYEAGIRWIELEWEISNFHLNNVKNGFHPSMLINFPIGQPSSEESFEIVRRLKNQYSGSDMAGNVMVTFSDSKDTAATFEPINLNASDERFIMLNEQVREGILKAHRVTNPGLFGIETPGKLGSRNELLESLEIFTQQYVIPKQRIIEKTFNWLRKINGINDELRLNVYKPQFSKINTNIKDILDVLQASITPEQKYHLLLQNEYEEAVSTSLTGYDPNVQSVQTEELEDVTEGDSNEMIVNENIKNMTAKQHQQLLRIIRQFKRGQLDKLQASILIKSGLGLDDSEVEALLGDIPE
jgi:hypothetical protein